MDKIINVSLIVTIGLTMAGIVARICTGYDLHPMDRYRNHQLTLDNIEREEEQHLQNLWFPVTRATLTRLILV